MTDGHAHWLGREVDSPDEVRKAAREQLKRGTDIVKCIATDGVLMPGTATGASEFAEAEIRALVEVTSVKDVPIAAHAHDEDDIESAVRTEILSVEHGMFMDEEAADLMVDNGTCWVSMAPVIYEIVEAGVEAGTPPEVIAEVENAAERFEGVWLHAPNVGVNIAMGTNAGTSFNDHGENALHEMELPVEYGLSSAGTLEATTVGGADLPGLGDMEKAVEGYVAGLVVFDADSSEDVGAWWTVWQVYREGKRIV